MLKEKISAVLTSMGQPQLLTGIDLLSEQQLEQFFKQLQTFDAKLLSALKTSLFTEKKQRKSLLPIQYDEERDLSEDAAVGKQLLEEGKAACLILAGGMGSRLQASVPKALIEITPIKKKTLLQLFLEKAMAASRRAQRFLPLAIMTSPLNHPIISRYLIQNNWFGYPPSAVALFSQSMLPFLDDRGNWLLEEPGKIAAGPDGNGSALKGLFTAHIAQKWQQDGVVYVSTVLIDNPLADPFDVEMLGLHQRCGSAAILKAVKRESVDEKVGLLALEKDRLTTVEYSEMEKELKEAKNSGGGLLFPLANTGLFSLELNRLQTVVLDPLFALPWHWARKQAAVLLNTCEEKKEEVFIWKAETFFFDILNYVENARVLVCPRQKTFAPLKTMRGENDLESVQKALIEADKQRYFEVTGVNKISQKQFELDPAFYYPTDQLIAKWRGCPLPKQEYIEA
ncbi:MAG: UTP--glucose-1-phosphate uridylyltransferase [Anaerolineae bacterium]